MILSNPYMEMNDQMQSRAVAANAFVGSQFEQTTKMDAKGNSKFKQFTSVILVPIFYDLVILDMFFVSPWEYH